MNRARRVWRGPTKHPWKIPPINSRGKTLDAHSTWRGPPPHEFKATFFGTAAMFASGCRPDTSRQKIRPGIIRCFISTTDRICSIPRPLTIGVDWQADEAADRLIREGRIPPSSSWASTTPQRSSQGVFALPFVRPPVILRPQGPSYPTFLIEGDNALRVSAVPDCRGPENTGAGWIFARRHHLALRCVIARECSAVLLLESPSSGYSNRQILRRQPRPPSLAGQDLSRHRHKGTWAGRKRPPDRRECSRTGANPASQRPR